jgi:hypothetical protein
MMTKLIVIASIAGASVMFVPRPVAAEECATEYTACLNDTYHLKGWLQTMADISCFASYTGCVADEILKS